MLWKNQNHDISALLVQNICVKVGEFKPKTYLCVSIGR